MNTTCLITLEAQRHEIAERQRRAGISLADWLTIQSKGFSDETKAAEAARYIARNIERINKFTQQLADIDDKIREAIEKRTEGMSEEMKQLVTQGGAVLC